MSNIYVSSGEVSNGVIVSSYDSMFVLSAGVANETTVTGDWTGHGDLYIYSGGTANSTTVSSGGRMFVSSGGVANSTTVNRSGYLYVSSGGVANSTTVTGDWTGHGDLYIYSGGEANSTTVSSYGSMYVFSGGAANQTTVKGRGYLFVSSGGVANSTTVNSNGSMYISSGGTALNVVWTPFVGCVNVDDGATVTFASSYQGVYFGSNNTLLSSVMTMTGKTLAGHSMYVMNGGEANSTTMNGGEMYVSTGGMANSTTVSGGYLYVSSGGVANETTVNDSGKLYVYNGGVATAIKENGGYVDVADGATATFVANSFSGLVLSYGSATLHSGTTANSTTVGYYGELHVSNGGEANSTNVSGGGCLYVSSGGVANSTTVSHHGRMYVSSGGVANSTIVNSGGSMYVSSGGVANSTTVNNWGYLYVDNGGNAYDVSIVAGGRLNVCFSWNENRHFDTIENGTATIAKNVTIVGNSMYVSSGGVANSTIVNGSVNDSGYVDYGYLYISSGGIVNDTTVNSYGSMFISSGASAFAVRENGGYVEVADGASVTFVANSLSGWVLYDSTTLHSGTTANSITVHYSGHLYIFSGGIANETKVTGYDLEGVCGSLYVYSGGTANKTSLFSGGCVNVSNGGVVNFTSVNRGGKLLVSSGGVANSTTVFGGTLCVYSGCTANNTMIRLGGSMCIYSGCVTSNVINSGRLYVFDGGTANSTAISGGGMLYVSSGGVVNSTTINSFGGAGRLLISSGGTANHTTVNSGSMYVFSGGVANATTISGGTMFVSSGGLANNTILSYGFLYISSGGTADSAVVSGGYIFVYSGGTATKINVLSNASFALLIASDTYIQGTVAGSAFEMKNASISNFTINNRNSMYISSGGVTNNTFVGSGGYMIIASGGKATGLLTVDGKAFVSAYAGSIINFDISHTSAGSVARVNDLSLIRGTPDYTVTVSAKQTEGAYSLAAGAAGFDKTVTVNTDAGDSLGTLAVGETFTVSNVNYTLALEGGALSLGVAFDTTPSAQAEALTDDTATRVYGSDLAARWTADTAAPGAVTLVTSDFGGDAWLDIDGAEVAGALYGASCDYSGTVNIDAKAGSIRNLAAGAAAGGSVAAVNLTLAGADLAGNAYAGGQGNVAGGIDTAITSGTFAKDFYAGALANYAKTGAATSVGDVTLTVEGGVFSGKLYGASAVKAGADSGGDTVHTAGDVNVTLAGGTAENSEFCLFGGGYATGSSDSAAPVYTAEMVSVSISGGDWGSARSGRGIYGGIFASGVAAEAAGVTISVSGGRMGNIYGGGWAQKGGTSTVGDVDITIGGSAEVANVYGGGAHSTTAGSGGTTVVNGVCITVSGGNITDAIYARGLYDGDAVTGDATVIFTGANDYGCGVFGYSYVSGDDNGSVLIFSGYTGEFSGEIGGFDALEFDGGTAVTLASAAADINNRNWKFDVSERAAELADTAFLTWSDADFADAAIALDLAAAPTSAWTLVEAAADTEYGELEVLVDGVSLGAFSLGEQIADGDYAGWGFALEDAALKFKRLA